MSDWRHVWTFEIKPPFKKQYKGLDATTRRKVDYAMRDLQGTENPALLGRYKRGMRVFSYDVGRKHNNLQRKLGQQRDRIASRMRSQISIWQGLTPVSFPSNASSL